MFKGLADQFKEKATIAIKEQLQSAMSGGDNNNNSNNSNNNNNNGGGSSSYRREEDSGRRYEEERYDDGRGNHGRTERYERQDDQGRYERQERQEHYSSSSGGHGQQTTTTTSYSSSSHSTSHDNRRDDRRNDDDRHGNYRRDDDRRDDRRNDGRHRRDDDQEQDHTVDHHGHDHPNFSNAPHVSTSASSGKNSSQYAEPPKMNSGSTIVQNIPGSNNKLYSSDCRGNKKALFIGINYTGTNAALNGCINDVHNIRQFLQENYGLKSDHCVQLTDDQEDAKYLPTRSNITNAMHWLVRDAQPGDSLFLHYSGHGATTEDLGMKLTMRGNGDEKDGQDETLVPLDYEKAELHEILVKPLKPGVRLTSVFDCCHSGTILDLPFTYKCDGEIEVITDNHHKEVAMAILHAGMSLRQGDVGSTISQLKEGFRLFKKPGDDAEAQKRTEQMRRSDADVIQFSGCRDDQTSADATIDSKATGAMSHALIKVLKENPRINYTDLLYKLRNELKGKYTQIPQMSTGRPMDMETEFIM
ncbi:caspase domain-containing protein [Syncephalis fuscata]|nr:caspase domain-containing protein [Syncephalis fuscata]